MAEATAAELTNDVRGDPLDAILTDPDLGIDSEMIEAAYNLLRMRYTFQSLLNPEEYPAPPIPPSGCPYPEIPPLAEILKAPDKPPPIRPHIPKPPTVSKHGPSVKGKEKGVKRSRNGYKTQGEASQSVEDKNEATVMETSDGTAQNEDSAAGISRFQKLIHGSDPKKTPKVRPLPICKYNVSLLFLSFLPW